jgi:hypothetical protein
MAETRTVNLEIKDNVKSLKTQYKEAVQEVQKLADAYGATSTEAANAAKNAANLKDRIEESKSLTDAFNPDAKFNALSGAIGGVLNGFQAYEGAMGLIGVENEDLQKTLLKVQSAMALSQGIQGALEAKDAFKNLGSVLKNTAIGQGLLTVATTAYNFVTTATTKGLKLFRIALISTGIGALVVGVGLLVANFDKLLNVFTPVIDGLKNIGDAIGLTDFAGDKRAKNEKARSEAELKQIQKIKEQKEKAFNNEQKAIDRLIAVRSAEGKSVEALTKQKIAGSIAYQKELQKELQANLNALEVNILQFDQSTKSGRFFANVLQEKIDIVKTKNEEALNSILDSENELKIIDINAKKDAKDRNKTAVDNAKQTAQDLRNLKRQIQDEEIKAIEDVNQREQTQLIVTAQRRIEDLSLTEKDKKKNAKLITEIQNNLNKDLDKLDEAFYAAQLKAQEEAQKIANSNKIRLQREFDNIIEALAEQNFQNTLTEEQREIQAVNDKYFELQTLAKGNAEQLAIIEKAKADELGAIEKKAGEKSVEEARAVAEQKAAIQQQGLDVALQGVQLIKGLFEKSKGVQKAAVIAESAIGIAKMIISNKLANAGALATPQAIATSGAAAVPVIALNNISTGIGIAANIAATAKALKSLGGGSAPSAPAGGGGGGGGGGASTTPQFNTIGSSGVNQLAQLQQQPVQAYVVSGDVTSAQSLDRNRIQNATL